MRDKMKKQDIKGSFMIGGVTSYCVDMLEEGLFGKADPLSDMRGKQKTNLTTDVDQDDVSMQGLSLLY